VTGPRQSGTTTLCRATCPGLPDVSLAPLDVHGFQTDDPRGFLAPLSNGANIDEGPRTPDLFRYRQTEVDHNPAPGRFILTGSQQLGWMASVTQALAGRTGVLELYPPSPAELTRQTRAHTQLVPWQQIDQLTWTDTGGPA
jgi:predicted AAA+ superfamily ATPase